MSAAAHAIQPEPECPVQSHNEWDPLEEVVVGSPEGAMVPSWNHLHRALLPPGVFDALVGGLAGGTARACPQALVDAALTDLEELVGILRTAGVRVRRPER